MQPYSMSHVADDVLMRGLDETAGRKRAATTRLLVEIGEAEARRLFLPRGYPSMYRYCLGHLRMPEDAAYKCIRAARAARRFRAIFPMIEDGRLNVSGVVLLAPHLTRKTADELLAAAVHKSKAEIREVLARRFPRPDLPTRIVPLPVPSIVGAAPTPTPAAAPVLAESAASAPGCNEVSQPAPAPCELAPEPVEFLENLGGRAAIALPPTRIEPLAPERFALQVTIGADTHELLREAQALLGHVVPTGDVDRVLHRALNDLVQRLRSRKFGSTDRPRADVRRGKPNERRISAAIRREVAKRDGYRCTFVGDDGHRCGSRTDLEFDHVVPLARGGLTTEANLRLRCSGHNQLEAERVLGARLMKAKRERGRGRAG